MAKRILTSREAREFFAYCARFPIDDESNCQLPAAQIATVFSNAHRAEGASPARILDFMPFHPKGEDDELDEEFLEGRGW